MRPVIRAVLLLPALLAVPGADAVRAQAPDTVAAWNATANSRATDYGKAVAFACPGGIGPDGLAGVWGTDIYTDDSRVCAAAVHAGLITAAAGGTVTLIFGPGQAAYAASDRNGVASVAYPGWSRSFTFVRPDGTALVIQPTPEAASGLKPQGDYPNRRPGERYVYYCPAGFALAGVWGTDTYTDDSSVCSAAVHAGLLTPASGGMVIVEMRPRQPAYIGSARNGVTSSNFGEWEYAYVFVGPAQPIPTTVTVGPAGAPVPGSGPLPPGFGGEPNVPPGVGSAPPGPGGTGPTPPGGGPGPAPPGGGVAVAPGPGAGGPCANPRLQQVMDEWLARAVPTAEGNLRYEPWGRAVGQSLTATVTALPRPDTSLTRCEYLLDLAPRLPSRNLGTLLDYLRANGVI